jgi:hypothetical protein
MSTDVQVEVVIRRSPAEVAAFMFDPQNDPSWTGGVVEVKPERAGRLQPGSKVERLSEFLGRRFAYRYDVVDMAEDRFVEMVVEQPFPMQIRYQLDPVPEGTRASIRARGDASGFYRLASPLLNWMVRRNIQRDLESLRDQLERRDG